MQEGEVVVGFAVAAGGDAALGFQPGVGAFHGPAMAGLRIRGSQPAPPASPDCSGRRALWDRLALAPRPRDARFDLTLAQRLLERGGGIAAIGPQLLGVNAAPDQGVDQRQQMSSLVLVA